MKIKHLILLSSLLIVLFTFLAIMGELFYQKLNLERAMQEELNAAGRERATQIAQNVYLMTEAMKSATERTMADHLRVAADVLTKSGTLHFQSDDKVSWNAVNQYSGKSERIDLPKVYLDGTWLGQNHSFASETAVVDKVKSLVGGTCTIFQRMNEQGDMLRVATNVEQSDGTRAIGTYIPRTNPDGTPNPVIAKVLQGDIFHGRAFVVNAWYITAYQPIYNEEQQIVGVLYVGVKQDDLISLRNSIMDIVVGKTGYVYVLGAQGGQKGHYIISPHGEQDGENFYDFQDRDGNYPVREIIAKALALPEPEHGVIPTDYVRYARSDTPQSAPREKLAGIAYFEPWDWVIVAGYYLDDFQDVEKRVGRTINQVIVSMLLISGIVVLLALVFNAVIAERLFAPLNKTVLALGEMSKGHLDIRLPVRGRDEVSQISRAFNDMAANLQKVTAGRDELDGEIRARKEVEADLLARESEYRRLSSEFQTVLDSIQDALILISPDMHVIWANKSAQEIRWGMKESEEDGSYCYNYWHERDLPCNECVSLRCFESGEPQNMVIRTSSGTMFGVKAFPVKDAAGKVVNVIELASDITESVRLRQEAARHSQLASLGELAAGMAHEINNPNGLILLNLATLKAALDDSLAMLDQRYDEEGDFDFAGLNYSRMREELPGMLAEMQQSAQHIKRIVDDLKDFVRMEVTGHEDPFDVNQSVSAAVRLLTNQLKRSTDNFDCQLDPELPLVLGNAHRIEQVVMNLLINAAQALTCRTEAIHVATFHDRKKDCCVIEIRDQGSGIADENLLRLTDPFFTTKRAEGGTGLGLSVSARIVKEHKGELVFEKNAPKGTVVRVELPVIERNEDG